MFKKTVLILSFFFIFVGSVLAYTGKEIQEMSAILYAEAANDPDGWVPKLNTYYSAKRDSETLPDCMKRVSSAYRSKSDQYTKAWNFLVYGKNYKGSTLNSYEATVMRQIITTIRNFIPDSGWLYKHHESPSFYGSYDKMIDRLKLAWGPRVDFENPKKIGREYYFKLK